MLSESTLYCLAYLSDEQIEANGGIPSAYFAAMDEDNTATAEFAHSYLVGIGLFEEIYSEMPTYPNWPIEEPCCGEFLCPEL